MVRFDGGAPRPYSYDWPGAEPLAKGDRVVVPPSWANAEYSFATVTAPESDYTGDCKLITGLVNPDDGTITYPLGEPE